MDWRSRKRFRGTGSDGSVRGSRANRTAQQFAEEEGHGARAATDEHHPNGPAEGVTACEKAYYHAAREKCQGGKRDRSNKDVRRGNAHQKGHEWHQRAKGERQKRGDGCLPRRPEIIGIESQFLSCQNIQRLFWP